METTDRRSTNLKETNYRPLKAYEILFIGLVSGMIAALFPRFAPLLVVQDKAVDAQFISQSYFILVAVFAFIVAFSTLFLYWRSDETKPSRIFVAALSIPSLLSGSLNMTADISNSLSTLKALTEENRRLQQVIDENVGADLIIKPEETAALLRGNNVSDAGSLFLNLIGIRSATAQTIAPPIHENTVVADSKLGIQYKVEPLDKDYLLVVKQPKSATERAALAQLLKQHPPLRKRSDGWLVLSEPLTQGNALLQALELNKTLGSDLVKILKLNNG